MGGKRNMEEVEREVYASLFPKQQEFIDNTEHKILAVSAGYGAGKTRALCAKAFSLAMANQGYRGCVMEPTGPLIRDIWQNDFDEFLDHFQIPHTFRASPLPEYILHLPRADTQILCRSFENWSRIIGLNLAWCLADEMDTVNKRLAIKAFNKILGRLRAGDVRQFGIASTPEGYAFMYDEFGSADALKRTDRKLIKMKTTDNPHLPDDFIDTLRANYDANQLTAYLDGDFINLTTGKVYYRFDREKHVIEFEQINDHETIHVGMDFNVGNCNAILAVQRNRKLYVFDYISGAKDTDVMAAEIRRRYPDHVILAYPDASGASRSTNSSRSDVAILESEPYRLRNQSPRANPPIRDRVNAVQHAFEDGKGEVHLFIAPSVGPLIEDLELQCYDDNGDPDKDSGRDHRPDALGYMVHRLFEVGRPRVGQPIRGIRVY
jgi:hypothetical protein